eukprot:gnl/TRDRNA2_/TRDRNA2_140440_c2_seq1.p1 gnl/TRDRNA2_/TRDRNA2_140440_c2~~gnl/TRDRNA2_/TRDRNA2_140440_c2_seq1.p1  ORF type:complete len:412 (-),score=60.42 gnl/TRDRNA2_/TRDRNA2_140440_c2_seq1:105-1166(-)
MTAFEAYLAVENSKSFDLVSPIGCIATTRPFAIGAWCFGDFDSHVAEIGVEFDILQVAFKLPAARRLVLNCISKDKFDADTEPPKSSLGYVKFNQRLRAKFAGPLVREAAYDGNWNQIIRILELCPTLNIESSGLAGYLGQGAIHCATAGGHAEVVQQLLVKDSSPNAQDREGESPLHYAALAGHAAIAQLLVNANADVTQESFSAEWPIEVAQNNPAYFLGVDTTEVIEVLTNAEADAKGMWLRQALIQQREERYFKAWRSYVVSHRGEDDSQPSQPGAYSSVPSVGSVLRSGTEYVARPGKLDRNCPMEITLNPGQCDLGSAKKVAGQKYAVPETENKEESGSVSRMCTIS